MVRYNKESIVKKSKLYFIYLIHADFTVHDESILLAVVEPKILLKKTQQFLGLCAGTFM